MSEQYSVARDYVPVGERSTETRAAFISKTYNHLMGAIVAFTALEMWLFASVALMFWYVLRIF